MGLRFSPLFSSSAGNSTFIATEKPSLLIDAGVTGSALAGALSSIDADAARLSAILVTHEHIDHIKSVGVLSRKYGIPVYANAETWCRMEGKIGEISSRNIRVVDKGEFFIGDICVAPVGLHHDAACPIGYCLMAGAKKIGILTDTGKVTAPMLSVMEGASIMLLEANHDIDMLKNGSYPYPLKRRILSSQGHLSNVDAGSVSIELCVRGVRGIILGHISRENNHKQLAFNTVANALLDAGVVVGKDVSLMAARRSGVTGVFVIK